MDLFDLWPGRIEWWDVVFRIGSALTGMFLLFLAGLTFTQLFRRPKPAWLFLGAIGLALSAMWGLDLGIRFLSQFIGMMGGISSGEWMYFALNIGSIFIGLILASAMWWCLIVAVFDPGEPPPELDDAREEPA